MSLIPGQISMKRWHHHLQIFVAYFGYLRQIKLYADAEWGGNLPTKVAAYLQELRRSAQSVLCNLEYAQRHIRSLRPRKRQLFHIPAQVMRSRLPIGEQVPAASWQRRSTQRGHSSISRSQMRKVNPLTLKFLKSHYLQYLRRLNRILRTRIRKLCTKARRNRQQT